MASTNSIDWQCIACGNQQEDLYILPCQHRFCDKCLNSWLVIYIDHYRGNGGVIPCQICWAVWKLPVTGLEALKQNYGVFSLQNQLREFTMATQDNDNTMSPCNNPFASQKYTSDVQHLPSKSGFFVSGHSYQNESIPDIVISPVSPDSVSMGSDSAMCQNDDEIDQSRGPEGMTVIQENVAGSARFFHGNSGGGPSVGVCRRIEQYHDYDMHGAGHYY